VDTRRAVFREKYDGAGMVVGLAELGVAEDVAEELGVFLGPEARRKDQGGVKPMLDLRLVSASPVIIGVTSVTDVLEYLRGLSEIFKADLEEDNDARGEQVLEESDSMADSRQVSRV